MAAEPQLDAAGSPRKAFVILFLVAVLALGIPAFAQDPASEQARFPAAKSAFDAGHWEEAAKLAQGPRDQPPELDFLAGLALARLEKWGEAKASFEAGARKAPRDPRFLVELAGIAYKQRDFRTAENELHAALRLDPRDSYSNEFLATIISWKGIWKQR
jgi:Flp pilus assembly protein TadD